MRSAAFKNLVGGALVALFLIPAALPGLAADSLDQRSDGPGIGTSVAGLIDAKDQTGTARDFPSLRGRKGLMLLFSRSFDW